MPAEVVTVVLIWLVEYSCSLLQACCREARSQWWSPQNKTCVSAVMLDDWSVDLCTLTLLCFGAVMDQFLSGFCGLASSETTLSGVPLKWDGNLNSLTAGWTSSPVKAHCHPASRCCSPQTHFITSLLWRTAFIQSFMTYTLGPGELIWISIKGSPQIARHLCQWSTICS